MAKKKVLLVDDEIFHVELLEEQLKEWYEIIRAYDGLEGLELAQTEKPDVIVCDVMMPRMGGIEFCEALRNIPGMANIPFIFLSAKGRIEDRVKGLRVGADDYVLKPIDIDELRARIDSRLNRLESIKAELEQFKNDIISNVSHELRTPLTIIKGYIELLLRELSNDDRTITNYIEQIDSNSTHLDIIIEDLIFLSELKSGTLKFDTYPIFIGELLENILIQEQETIRHKKLELVRNFTPDMGHLNGDPVRLSQAFRNVIDNAIKFTPEGGKIEINMIDSPTKTHVYVRDSGEGISEDAMPHIYENFYQGDTSATRHYGGTGTGLFVTKTVLNHYHGTITARNIEQGGCEFEICLPKN
ncbi:MAG: hybrid sensor histidine kinase/response regulator [Gemmatimonadetes bacterium]|nr:MAG: hybrid sensor histidine kinase/response regulator [Gemmatimonadota bacterium]